jgi:hypothetical protein
LKWLLAVWLWVWGVVSFLPRWLLARWLEWKPRLFRRKARLFRFARVDEFPDSLESSTVYLAGEGEHLWAAAMICPCGCGEIIELNLLKQVRPCWSVKQHPDGLVSLTPSVWCQKGCRSHFFVRHGRIDWC